MNTVVGKNGVDLPEDIFERSKLAQEMCGAIMNMSAEEYFPVVIDGPWGSGKTVHAARMMKCFADKHSETVKCIYWNASDTDYASEPLSMFISALYSNITEDKLKHKGQQIIKACGELLVSRGGSVAQKMVISYLSGILGVDISSVCNVITELINKSSAKNETELRLEGSLNDCKMEKTPLENAKYLIEQVKDEGKQLIIIIDELDRCRPDYALKTLEVIKHLFSMKECKFVLVMNKKSLVSSVRHLYGFEEESARRYLDKYLKFEFYLSGRSSNSFCSEGPPQKYFWKMLQVNKMKVDDSESVSEFLTVVFNRNGIELRDVEKYVNTIKVVMCRDGETEPEITIITCFVGYLFAFEKSLLYELYYKKVEVNVIMDIIGNESELIPTMNGSMRAPFYVNYIRKLLELYMLSYEQRVKITNNYEYHTWKSVSALKNWICRCVKVRG